MLKTKAVFQRKEPKLETQDCVIEKIVKLGGSEFDLFSRTLLRDNDLITENIDHMYRDENHVQHCLLVVSDSHSDGLIIQSEGYPYARYVALIPHVQSFLREQNMPLALKKLTDRLTGLVDWLSGEIEKSARNDEDLHVDIRDMENQSGLDIQFGSTIFSTVMDMLGEHYEILDVERDGYELAISVHLDEDIINEQAPQINM